VVASRIVTSVDYDEKVPWRRIDDSSWLPARFRIRKAELTKPRIPDVVVVVNVEVVDPKMAAGLSLYDEEWTVPVPIARSVEVGVHYGEVQQRHLAGVRVADLVEDGSASVMKGHEADINPGLLMKDRNGRRIRRVLVESAATSGETRQVRGARKAIQIPRVDLGLVASTYRHALAEGRRDPTVAVAETIGRARSTAASYVSRARSSGLLAPVDQLTIGRMKQEPI
jgi:hypothetical protein